MDNYDDDIVYRYVPPTKLKAYVAAAQVASNALEEKPRSGVNTIPRSLPSAPAPSGELNTALQEKGKNDIKNDDDVELEIVQLPPPPPGVQIDERILMTTMATFHICRICHRPRSDSFHRENPILPGRPLPAPTICRRCRVSKPGDIEKEVYHIAQSEPVSIGVGSFLPRTATLTVEQAQEEIKKSDKELKQVRKELEQRQDAAKKQYLCRYLDEEEVRDLKGRTDLGRRSSRRVVEVIERNVQHSNQLAQKQSTDIAPVSQGAGKPSIAVPFTPAKQYTESAIRGMIREEARDVFLRLRNAERQIEAHPAPYSHGLIVQDERDAPQPLIGSERKEQKRSSRLPAEVLKISGPDEIRRVKLENVYSRGNTERDAELQPDAERAPGKEKASAPSAPRPGRREADPMMSAAAFERARVYNQQRSVAKAANDNDDPGSDGGWTDRQYWMPDKAVEKASDPSSHRQRSGIDHDGRGARLPGIARRVLGYTRDVNTDDSVYYERRIEAAVPRYSDQRQSIQQHRAAEPCEDARGTSPGSQPSRPSAPPSQPPKEAPTRQERGPRVGKPGKASRSKETAPDSNRVRDAPPLAFPNPQHFLDPEARRSSSILSKEKVNLAEDERELSSVRFKERVDVSETPPGSEDFLSSADEKVRQWNRRRSERDRRPGDGVAPDRGRAGEHNGPPAPRLRRVPSSESPSREQYMLESRRSRRHEDLRTHGQQNQKNAPKVRNHAEYADGPYRDERASRSIIAQSGSSSEPPAPCWAVREV